MKIVFFGTPIFALKPFERLIASRHQIVAVVSQPDRAKDRKSNLLPTPVKEAAQKCNIPVYQFESVKKEGIETLKRINADIFVTAAYGQILSQEILDIPRYGVINIHASLLPKYRGASPIQCAIMAGERETGVTIMQTDIGLDTGDILTAEKIAVMHDDTAATLSDKLSVLGAELLVKTFDLIENNKITRMPQDHSKAAKCPLITKAMGRINWNDSAEVINNKIRAIDCYTFLDGLRLKILIGKVVDNQSTGDRSSVGKIDKNFVVQCGVGRLEIAEVLPENKKKMSATEFLAGHEINGKVLN